jgi:uncharacterized protein (PEP-CTERM system associated)
MAMVVTTEGTDITAMASHGFKSRQSDNQLYRKDGFCRQPLILALFLFQTVPAAAGEWEVIPRVSVAEIFTDNIDLEPENEQSALITELTPGISIRGRGGRFEGALDYQIQNFISGEFSDSVKTAQQLIANSTTELRDNLLFFDAGGRIGQSIINADDTISLSNYNNDRNRTDTYSYTLSPYLTPHFSNFADGTLRYSYSEVFYSDEASLDSTGAGARDSTVTAVDARLVSGRFFRDLSWVAHYDNRNVSREESSDDTFEEADAEARYRITRAFSLVAQGGWTNNDFQSNRRVENGTYWGVGGFWQPSRFYSIEALAGNNLKTATLGLYPTVRTALEITYRDRDVGLNAGKQWTGSLTHRTRRTRWRAGYTEDTTTTQQQALQASQGFLPIDPVTGDVNPNPQPGDVVVLVPLPPIVTLTDEVIERKRAFGSVGVNTGKTGLRVSVFDQRQDYQSSNRQQTTRGISGSWDWRLAPRTNWILTGSWQRIENNGASANIRGSDFWYIQPQLRRQIRRNLEGSLTYRFVRQDSDDDQQDYDENSIIARLTAYF